MLMPIKLLSRYDRTEEERFVSFDEDTVTYNLTKFKKQIKILALI
jgi:hypothetical protein